MFILGNYYNINAALAMKSILFLTIIFVAFSCQTNHYKGKLIKENTIYSPRIKNVLGTILLGNTDKQTVDSTSLENCMKGLRFTLELQSNIKISDIIVLNAKATTSILNELKTKYRVDGLLLLYKLKIQKQAYDVESKKLYLFPESHGAYAHPAYWSTVPWTNIEVIIISKWVYFDVVSGRHYNFEIKNKKVVEFGKYVQDGDGLLDGRIDLLDALFYQNGKMMAEKFLNKPEDSVD